MQKKRKKKEGLFTVDVMDAPLACLSVAAPCGGGGGGEGSGGGGGGGGVYIKIDRCPVEGG